jgi:ketosteroid isomerase-like protein
MRWAKLNLMKIPPRLASPSSFFVLLGLAMLPTTASSVHAQAAPKSTEHRVITITTRDELTAFITATLKAWETKDRATFLAAFADDAVFAYPGGRASKAELAEIFDDLHARKTDVNIYVGPFIVAGNEFVVRYQFACTDRATGKRQAVGTGVRGTLRNNHIVTFKEYWDGHIPTEQMAGLLPLDEGTPDSPSPTSFVMPPTRIN